MYMYSLPECFLVVHFCFCFRSATNGSSSSIVFEDDSASGSREGSHSQSANGMQLVPRRNLQPYEQSLFVHVSFGLLNSSELITSIAILTNLPMRVISTLSILPPVWMEDLFWDKRILQQFMQIRKSKNLAKIFQKLELRKFDQKSLKIHLVWWTFTEFTNWSMTLARNPWKHGLLVKSLWVKIWITHFFRKFGQTPLPSLPLYMDGVPHCEICAHVKLPLQEIALIVECNTLARTCGATDGHEMQSLIWW